MRNGASPLDVLRWFLAAVVIVAWIASVAVFLLTNRRIDPGVFILMAGVTTALFGPDIWRRNGRNGEGP